MAKGGLGRGYETLFSDNTTEVQNLSTLRVAEIEPNREQPRKSFDDGAIAALADSIREHGMIQPILVRPLENGSYQIVAGERRWRAARMLGLEEVPVTIRAMSDQESMQIELIVNLQRVNLNPIEEAQGYQELMDQFGMTQEGIAQIVGRSRSAVANSLRLLQLPGQIQQYLQEGSITTGHAKALAGFVDEETMLACAARAADGQLTVRAIEKLAAAPKEHLLQPDRRRDSYYKEMELSLSSSLGRKVKVDQGRKKGMLILEYYDKDDLATLAKKLTE